MALPTPGAEHKGLLSFRLFGFPVTIHASFLVVVLLLGFTGPDGMSRPGTAVLWLLIVTVSVVVHELGHALAARPVGGDPRIDLYMMAGLTTWQPGGASRARRVGVSVAGPAAGVLLGVAVLLAYVVVRPPVGSALEDALTQAVWVNVGWGLLNLLPMLPLDGGQVVLALMPGRDELVRVRRASYASLGVAAVVAAAALAVDPLAAMLVLFFGAGNLQRIVALRKGDDGPTVVVRAEEALQRNEPEEAVRLLSGAVPEAYRVHAAVIGAAALLRLGRDREAQDRLVDLPPGIIDPVFEAAVLWANGQQQLARERLVTGLRNDPPAWAVRELVLVLRRREEDVVSVVGGVTGAAAAGVLDALFLTGDHAAAAAWGERAMATGAADPVVAYNTACSYARAGDLDRAVRAAGYAAQLGWDNVEAADSDDDLAPVRARPEWAEIRRQMAENAGLGASSPGR